MEFSIYYTSADKINIRIDDYQNQYIFEWMDRSEALEFADDLEIVAERIRDMVKETYDN